MNLRDEVEKVGQVAIIENKKAKLRVSTRTIYSIDKNGKRDFSIIGKKAQIVR